MYIGIIIILACTTLIFLGLWLSMRHSVKEIVEEMKDKMSVDTNTLITVSTADAYLRKLAAKLNQQLIELKQERRKYETGDAELKLAVTNISHDIRTPLTAICSYLDLLDETEKSDAAARYLEVIKGRAKSLCELTEELFHYSVVVSQAKELDMQLVSVNEVLEESMAEFYAALKAQGIVPDIAITDEAIIYPADRKALSRVFANVINNALKYSAGDLEIELNERGELFFTNTAPELNEVQVGKLFDRFYTVETSRKSTGLGLTIARTLMEQMHGSITAEYENGRLRICIKFKELQNE